MKNFQFSIFNFQKGIIALPTMLLVGGIIAEIGIAGFLISYFLIQSNFGARWSAEALATAQAGVQDGIIKVIRDKNTSGNYSIPAGDWTSEVEINKDIPSSGKHEIISSGTVKNKQRKLQAILNVNSLTGEVKTESIKEMPI